MVSAPVTLQSPALEVMTDLTLVKAATTQPGTSLRQAEQMMIYQGVRMLFVVSDMPSLEGLITTTDLGGDRAMRIVSERNLHHDDLCVADVMTPLSMLEAIDHDRMRHATVGNVIASSSASAATTCWWCSAPPRRRRSACCGVISRTQIERQLGAPIEITPIASSFAEIERALS